MKQHTRCSITRRNDSPGAVALLIAALLVTGCAEEPKPPPAVKSVFALRIENLGEFAERSFPGRARAGQQVNRSFRVAGPLIEFPASVGDEVKEGELLARIDPTTYQSRVASVGGELRSAVAARDLAEAEFNRAADIKKKNPDLISDSEYDQRLGRRDTSRAQVTALESALKLAEDDLSYTFLQAPFDGVVVETYVENFETVIPRQPILRVLDPSSIEFVVQVPENLIGLAPYVESVAVRFDALPSITVDASIKEIGREVSQATRTYPVTLVMEQPEGAEILPGMAGQATIRSKPPENHELGLVGIDIPMTAVFNAGDEGKSFVWVIDRGSNTISRREITLGRLTRLGVLVASGLESGEWIVTKGVNTLSEGQEVNVLKSGTGETA